MFHKALATTAHLPNNSNAQRSVNKVQLATKLASASEMRRHAWPWAQAARLFCMYGSDSTNEPCLKMQVPAPPHLGTCYAAVQGTTSASTWPAQSSSYGGRQRGGRPGLRPATSHILYKVAAAQHDHAIVWHAAQVSSCSRGVLRDKLFTTCTGKTTLEEPLRCFQHAPARLLGAALQSLLNVCSSAGWKAGNAA